MGYPARLERDLDNFFNELCPNNIEARIHAARTFDVEVNRKACALLKEEALHYHPDHDFRLSDSELFQNDPEMALQALQLWTRCIAAKTHDYLIEKKQTAKINVQKVVRERAIATARLNPIAVVAARMRGNI